MQNVLLPFYLQKLNYKTNGNVDVIVSVYLINGPFSQMGRRILCKDDKEIKNENTQEMYIVKDDKIIQ